MNGIFFYYNQVLDKNFKKFRFRRLKIKDYDLIDDIEFDLIFLKAKTKEDQLLFKLLAEIGPRISEV